jgi:hypothetical protein
VPVAVQLESLTLPQINRSCESVIRVGINGAPGRHHGTAGKVVTRPAGKYNDLKTACHLAIYSPLESKRIWPRRITRHGASERQSDELTPVDRRKRDALMFFSPAPVSASLRDWKK